MEVRPYEPCRRDETLLTSALGAGDFEGGSDCDDFVAPNIDADDAGDTCCELPDDRFERRCGAGGGASPGRVHLLVRGCRAVSGAQAVSEVAGVEGGGVSRRVSDGVRGGAVRGAA